MSEMASGKCHPALEEFRSEIAPAPGLPSPAVQIAAPPPPRRSADIRKAFGWLVMAACAVGVVDLVEQLRTPPPLPMLMSRAPSLPMPAPLPIVVPKAEN